MTLFGVALGCLLAIFISFVIDPAWLLPSVIASVLTITYAFILVFVGKRTVAK